MQYNINYYYYDVNINAWNNWGPIVNQNNLILDFSAIASEPSEPKIIKYNNVKSASNSLHVYITYKKKLQYSKYE